MNLLCNHNWVSSFFMGNGNFVGMFVHYFSWAWKEIFFLGVIFHEYGKKLFFFGLDICLGHFRDGFMEMKDFWVDWNIVGCFRI